MLLHLLRQVGRCCSGVESRHPVDCLEMAFKSLEDGPAEAAEAAHGARPSPRRRWLELGIVLVLGPALGLVLWHTVFKKETCPAGQEFLAEQPCDSFCKPPFDTPFCTADVKGPGCGCPKGKAWYYSGGDSDPKAGCYDGPLKCPNFSNSSCPTGQEFLAEEPCGQVCEPPFEIRICPADLKGPGCGCPEAKSWYYSGGGSDQKAGCYDGPFNCPNFSNSSVAPTTSAPTTEAPTTGAPTTEAPTTGAPTTKAP